MKFNARSGILALLSLGFYVGTIHAQTSFPEAEPNSVKAEANAVTFTTLGDSVAGNSQGTSITAGSALATTADTFRITLPTATPGIYRNRLVITSTIAGHTGTIRGLSQSAGVIGTGDNAAQTSSTATTPARFNQWYSFGQGETLFYRVAGTASTTADYASTWERQAVTPTNIGSFAAGTIEITTVGQGHTTDTDLWVYDSNFNAIPTYGNDDEFGTTSLQSRLSRTYAPGTYFLALTNFAFSNDQASPVDDDFRTGTVTDFPGVALNSSTTTNLNVAFQFTDANGVQQFASTKAGAYDINWFQFSVGTAVPEPTTWALMGTVAVGTGGYFYRRYRYGKLAADRRFNRKK